MTPRLALSKVKAYCLLTRQENAYDDRGCYECGSDELIAIYNIMRQTDGIYGGRFSGAGFKGACIALVDPAKKEAIRQQITEEYLRMFPEYTDSFEIHFCKTDNGARFLK